MNLLNSIFNEDDIEISSDNKKYCLIGLILLILLTLVLLIKKDNYYTNNYSVGEDQIILLVEKEYINKVKDANEIFIQEIKCGYSINGITPMEDNFLVSINLNTSINDIKGGNYKLYLGKETLFDYIRKIIKK